AATSLYLYSCASHTGHRDLHSFPTRRSSDLWWVPNDDIATHAGLGHIAVWNGNGPALGELMSAFRGHAGEAAGRRIERVCAEAGIPFRGIGDLDDTQPVGPQEPTVPLELIQQAAAVDGGVLYED